MFEIIKRKIQNFKEYFTTQYNSFKEDHKEYFKKLLVSSAMAIKAVSIFALKAAAFLVSIILFIEALQFILAGQLAMAALAFVPAVVVLRYSGLPFKIIGGAISLIATPVTYVVKTIFLTIVDHLLEELGIAAHAKNRPLNQFLKWMMTLLTWKIRIPAWSFVQVLIQIHISLAHLRLYEGLYLGTCCRKTSAIQL